MNSSNVKLLWGTANAFSHKRFMSGASTNPDPEVFAYKAAQVKDCMDATKRLGGSNYVLWVVEKDMKLFLIPIWD